MESENKNCLLACFDYIVKQRWHLSASKTPFQTNYSYLKIINHFKNTICFTNTTNFTDQHFTPWIIRHEFKKDQSV